MSQHIVKHVIMNILEVNVKYKDMFMVEFSAH